ncbi:MAG: GAF domain-containing protein [Candidatus Eisenbacteria bacterium]|nr:GAF domain-containing protein [Candidatus Eisenbacteria bacterium]
MPHSHSDPAVTIRRLRCQLSLQRLLSQRQPLETLGPAVIRVICESLDWDAGSLWIMNASTALPEPHSYWTAEDDGLLRFVTESAGYPFQPGAGLLGRVFATRTPLWIEDVTRAPDFRRSELAREVGLRTAFAFPMLLNDRVHGLVEIYARDVREADDELLEIAEGLGTQFGQYLEHAAFEQSLQDFADRRRRLVRIAESLRATLSPVDLTQLLAEGLERLVPFTTLALYAQAGEQLAPLVIRGMEWLSTETEAWVIPADQGIAGWVMRTGQAVMVNHAESDERTRYPEGAQVTLEHLMAFPLLREGAVTGVILMNRLQDPPFSHHEFDLAESLIATASQALEQSHLIRQLRAGEARKSAILDSALDCVIVTDENGVILEFNRAAQEAFGYEPVDVIGRGLTETIIPARHARAHAEGLNRHRETGEARVLGRRVELDARRADGSEFPIEVSIQETRVGDRVLYTANLRDITERRREQEELVRSRDVAHRSLEMRNEFFARMSHEIRTPMNGVVGLTRLLLGRPLDEESRELAQHLIHSSEHLLTIVNDILDLSSVDAGRLVLHPAPYTIRDLVEESLAAVRPEAERKDIQCGALVAPEVPEVLLVDPVRLRQVLLNLMSNSVKFTDHGVVALECRCIGAPGAERRLRFDVRDSGRGMSKERREQLFSEEGSVPRDPDGPSGAGLGFQIVRRIVLAMGGGIELTSQPGRGTQVAVTLPCVEAAPHQRLRPSAGVLTTNALDGLRVLVVEDNPINQIVAQKTLEGWGAAVVLADRGSVAIAKLEQAPVDVVLMDIQLIGEDGFTVTREIRANAEPRIAAVPILAMTASVLHDARERCLEAGMNDFVMKPFDPADLLRKLTAATGRPAPSSGALGNPLLRPGDSHVMQVMRTGTTIDIAYLREVSRGNDAVLLQTLRVFLDMLPARLAHLRESATAGDADATARAAHTLRPSLKMVGLTTLESEAARLESPGLATIGQAQGQHMAERIEREGHWALLELRKLVAKLESRASGEAPGKP